MALFFAAIRRDSVSLFWFPFLSYVHVFSCEMLLKMSIELFFFQFLLSSYFFSIDPCDVSIVSGGCSQFSSALFYVVFELLCYASTLSSMLACPLFSIFS